MKTNLRKAAAFICVLILLFIMMAPQANAATLSLTVTNTASGYQTIPYPGVCSGNGRWNLNDMKDLGMNTIRWWTGFYNMVPVDPDGVYGGNTPAEIKANPNVINWSAYDTQFYRPDPFDPTYPNSMTGVSYAQMLQDCKDNGIVPMLGLEATSGSGDPSWLSPIPVRDEASRNEVWEFAFAMVYYTNVVHDWRVDHWGVENEPDATTEAWGMLGGTMQEYYQYLAICKDAIDYVYNTYLGGRAHYIHGPLSSDFVYAEETLQQADASFNVVDYHRYYDMLQLADVWGWVQTYDSDGVLEPIWLSEWGLMYDQYDFANSLMEIGYFHEQQTVTRGHVMGSNIYSLSPWVYPGPWTSPYLIADDGTKTEMYYALKTFLKAAGQGRDVYNVTGSVPADNKILATKDADNLYFLIINQTGTTNTINLNVSAHVSSGTASVMEWSSAYKATVSQTPTVSSGNVSFTSRSQSVAAVTIPLAPDLARGKTATADSYYPGDVPGNGNDGNYSTSWCANDGNTGHWWKVDLGSNRSITNTQVKWEKADIYKYKIEVSTDNVNWTMKVDKRNNTSSDQVQKDFFTATARYVRITVTGLSGYNWACFSDFKVLGGTAPIPTPSPTPTPILHSQGKVATTDSYYPGSGPAKGNDGSYTTSWCANDGNAGHWWKVDLGSNKSLTSTQVKWEFADIYKYKVEVSTDNVNWTLVVDEQWNTSKAQTQTDYFNATARYVRITVTELTGTNWACFSEFKVFGN